MSSDGSIGAGWQLPISSTSNTPDRKKILHWFALCKRTDVLVPAACGLEFNPGFAKRGLKAQHLCLNCLVQIQQGTE